MKNKTNTVIIILLIVILVLLIYLSFKPKDVNAPLNKSQTFGEQVLQNSNQPTKSINTYTYTNHGFSIELPKGFVPNEEQSEGGPSTTISMPLNNMIVYVTNADFWERHNFSSIEEGNICEKGNIVIGNKTFKTCKDNYSNNPEFYWLRVGNIGYEIHGNKNDFKTFKFIGWGEPVHVFTKDGISFSYPIDVKAESSIASDGYKVIELTKDGAQNKITLYYAPVGTNAARAINGCFEMDTQKVILGGKEFIKCSSKAEPTDTYVLKSSSTILNMIVDNLGSGTEIGSFIDLKSIVIK